MVSKTEFESLVRFLNGLNLLRRQDPDAARSILVLVNFSRMSDDQDATKIRIYQDLAEQMLDKAIFSIVIEGAKKLIKEREKLNSFLSILGEEIIEGPKPQPSELISKYMQKIAQKRIHSSRSTVKDYLDWCDEEATLENRYFIIVDTSTETMLGILSFKDYPDKETIKAIGEDAPAIKLTTFNPNPFTLDDSATMEDSAEVWSQGKEQKQITKLLIVNKQNKPVGTLDELDIRRWENDVEETEQKT